MSRALLRCVIRAIIAAAVVLVPQGGWSSLVAERNAPPLAPMPAHPGRLIVKYRISVGACAHCLLARGLPFASVTGRDSLDDLNRRLGAGGALLVLRGRR
jgi:hypothetical protein